MFSIGEYLERIDSSTVVDCVDGNRHIVSPGDVVRLIEHAGLYFKAELPNGAITSDCDLHMCFFKRAEEFNQPVEEKSVPHVHSVLIKAWADGAKIQQQEIYDPNKWFDVSSPSWNPDIVYRLAPRIAKVAATVRMVDDTVVFGRVGGPGLSVLVSVNVATNEVVDICKVQQ